jgi:hypothetical protein
VKTPTSNFRVEILSRLRWIGKELLCQSSPKEEREKTILRILCSRAFLHSLDPFRTSAQSQQITARALAGDNIVLHTE